MYSLKPIIDHSVELHHPDCMYSVKSIHKEAKATCNISKVTEQLLANTVQYPSEEIKMLEERQKRILAQLAVLKEQVFNISNNLKEIQTEKVVEHNSEPVNANLVMKVNPSKPCYSLLGLSKLWPDTEFQVTSYIFSGLTNTQIDPLFSRKSSSTNAKFKNRINIALIWKEVDDLELITSNTQSVIASECNFLRYLMRLLRNDLYERSMELEKAMKIDRIFDISYQLLHQHTSEMQKKTLLATLNDILKGKKWFSDNTTANICDLYVWSVMKQLSIKNLTSNMICWFKNCEQLFLTLN